MLTLNATHETELQKSASEPVVLVRIDLDSPASRIFRFVSGDSRRFGYPNSVDSISPLSCSIDPMSREVSIGQMAVKFGDDGAFAHVASTYIIKNKKATISLGFQGHAEADFEEMFVGPIDDFTRGESYCEMPIQDVGRMLDDQTFKGAFYGDHPLRQIQAIHEAAGISTDLYSLASLVPSLYSTTSHWGISRCGRDHTDYPWANREVVTTEKKKDDKGESAKDAINDILALMHGDMAPAEDGQATFVPFAGDAAVDDTWTIDDISEFEQLSNYEYFANRVIVTFNLGEKDPYARYQADDPDSQDDHQYPGTASEPHVAEYEIPTNWLNARAVLRTDITGASTTITIGPTTLDTSTSMVNNPSALGFSGACFSPAERIISGGAFAGTQESWRELSAADGRYAYLLIVHRVTDGFTNEIIRVREPVTFSSEYAVDQDGAYYPRTATYTIDARAQFGTTAVDHLAGSQFPVIDLTIPVATCPPRLHRFSYGASAIRVRTSLEKRAVQHRDFIAITEDVFLAYNANGLTSQTVFEVTSKEEDPSGDDPGIVWELVRVRGPAGFPVFEPDIDVDIDDSVIPVSADDTITDSTFAAVTTSTGLVLTRI